jgi:Tfp pilus assembly protein PilN
MSARGRSRSEDGPVIGGVPRVDLLPPEVRARRRARALRRSLVLAVVGVAAAVALATAGSFAYNIQANVALAMEQARTTSLLGQQAKYADIRSMQDDIKLLHAAQEVGASTEIQWKAYLEKVQATLPAGVSVQTVEVESASPLAEFQQGSTPFEGPRVATITFSARTDSFPSTPEWLKALEGLPGYVDATPNNLTRDEGTGSYTVSITMHVNGDVYDGRFSSKDK